MGKHIHHCRSVGVHRIILRPSERWELQLDDAIGVCFTMDREAKQEGTVPWERGGEKHVMLLALYQRITWQ